MNACPVFEELTLPVRFYMLRSSSLRPTATVGVSKDVIESSLASTEKVNTSTNDIRERGCVTEQLAVVRHATVYTMTRSAIGALTKDFRGAGKDIQLWLDCLSQEQLCALQKTCVAVGLVDVDVAGIAHQLMPAHLELLCEEGDIGWGRIGNGWLAAAGAPGERTMRSWRRQGVTCVISLLRESEPTFETARILCTEKNKLRWIHAPLSGKRAVFAPDDRDLESWARLRDVLPQLMQEGECVIVHCAAGMHRTGTTVFRTLRTCGFPITDALHTVEQMRPVTYGALFEDVGPKGEKLKMWEAAEALLGGAGGNHSREP